MEPTTNPTPTPSSAGDGVCTDEYTKMPPDSPHDSDKDDGVDFCEEQGPESNEAIDTENDSRSVDNNKYSETEDVATTKESQTESDSLDDDDVEIVIKNQHKYYFYCPCCGEDITKTIKLVKISDLQPTKNHDTETEAIDTENDAKSKDKKTKGTTWLPDFLQQLFPSVNGHNENKGKKAVDSKSPETYTDLSINGEEQSIDVSTEKDEQSFPKWHLDVFAWLFLCIIIALSVLSTSPPPFIQPHLQLPSMSSLSLPSIPLPSASVLLLLPTFAVLLLVIMAMRLRYSPKYHEEKGDKRVDSKSADTTSDEQSEETPNHEDQAANSDQDFDTKTDNKKNHLTPIYPDQYFDKKTDNQKDHLTSKNPDQDSDKKTDNQKNHLTPMYPSPREEPSKKIVNKENHENAEIGTPANTQAETALQPNAQPELPKNVEPRKDRNKIEILKSIVYGGLTESITSLCTVTSAAASGASTLNVLALGVANLSSGILLTVHSLQELINEKPKKRTNTDDQQTSEADEEEEDRYEEVLGRRENSRVHRVIAISSFVIFGLIPPLVYGFSFRRRIEKKQEHKVLAVYAVSLLCVVLLSFGKAYVSKRPEYLKTMFRYTTMATTGSGFSQFVGYLVSQWLERNGFYDDSSPQSPPL